MLEIKFLGEIFWQSWMLSKDTISNTCDDALCGSCVTITSLGSMLTIITHNLSKSEDTDYRVMNFKFLFYENSILLKEHIYLFLKLFYECYNTHKLT